MTFHLNQRVRVTEPRHPLRKKTGTVVQLRRGDQGAFVEMDSELPKKVAPLFPPSAKRERWVILQPGEVEIVEAPSK